MLIKIVTPKCLHCNLYGIVEVDSDAYKSWKFGGVVIQNAFPDMDVDDREQIKSGTHAACWDDMLGPEE